MTDRNETTAIERLAMRLVDAQKQLRAYDKGFRRLNRRLRRERGRNDELRAELEELLAKDRGKTLELNTLTAENRKLYAELKHAKGDGSS